MTPQQRCELLDLEAKATAGEWESVPVMLAGSSTDGKTGWGESEGRIINGPPQTVEKNTLSCRWFRNKYDGDLIAAARNAIRDLIVDLHAAQAEIASIHETSTLTRVPTYCSCDTCRQHRENVKLAERKGG